MLNSTSTCSGPDASGTILCSTIYAQSTSTDPSYFNGFSYGEIVLSTFSFLSLLLGAYAFFWFITKGFKIKQ